MRRQQRLGKRGRFTKTHTRGTQHGSENGQPAGAHSERHTSTAYTAASIPDAPRQSWHSSVNGHRVQRTVVRSTSPAAHHSTETRCAEAMLHTQRRNYHTTRSPYKQGGQRKRRGALRQQCRNGRGRLPTWAPGTKLRARRWRRGTNNSGNAGPHMPSVQESASQGGRSRRAL